MGPMLPEAGVTVASPATIPVTMPTRPGFPALRHSIRVQVRLATAAAMCVTSIVMPAAAFAPPWLPALKPNQPTQSMDAPIITMPGLCGG